MPPNAKNFLRHHGNCINDRIGDQCPSGLQSFNGLLGYRITEVESRKLMKH
ncbi:hypothetical protein RSAG8_03365, partial [Rhizoctonia solani AG-8 WAC10335]